MKKISLLITSVSLMLCSNHVLAQQVCQDDPRLYTIKKVISDVKEGKEISPLQITPSTYLAMSEKVVDTLNDNFTILDSNCVPVQVVDGEPAKKVEVAYETLNTALQHAAIRKDKEGVMKLFRLFKAKPKASKSIISLLGPLDWPQSAIEWSRAEGIISTYPQYGASNIEKYRTKAQCYKLAAYNTHIEVFSRFSGVVSDRETIISHNAKENSNGLYFADTNGAYYNTEALIGNPPEGNGLSCRMMSYPAILSALSAIGMPNVTNGAVGVSWGSHKSMDKWLKSYTDKGNENAN